ncbi:Integrase catalytic domain-containing protein [Palleronia rufa]
MLLRREKEVSGIDRIYRPYREEGLAVRKRRARRKAIGTRAPIPVEARPNARWSLDFVHDRLGCGRRFRILNVVDEATRECLAAMPDTSISRQRVARDLGRPIARRGTPGMIVSGNGPELTGNAILTFAATRGIERHSSRQASPCRMGSSRVSTDECETRYWTCRDFVPPQVLV